MTSRFQNTIQKAVEMNGVGFITGQNIRLRFLPADENEGICFQRTDLPRSQPVRACIENIVPQARRTVLEQGDVRIELIEHIMAALSGLQIDNCLIQLDGSEVPASDGSAIEFVNCILAAGIEILPAEKNCLRITAPMEVRDAASGATISVVPSAPLSADVPCLESMQIEYQLDYGDGSLIPKQHAQFSITPEQFHREISWSRTFILEPEVEYFRSLGYGKGTTTRDILVFGEQGVIGNALRSQDECARHKILDCIGDFALLECDLIGNISAQQSGHALNHQFIREIKKQYEMPRNEFRDAA